MSKKKTKVSRKPRKAKIEFTFAEDGSGTFELYANGAMRFLDADGNTIVPARVEVSSIYDRENGKEKVLTRGPGMPLSMHVDPNAVLLPFASIFAVDTNTRRIAGTHVSVSVLVRVVDIGTPSMKWRPLGAVEVHDARESPERLGWHWAMRCLEAACPRPPDFELSNASRRGIALVVDSDLGALAAINARSKPYFGTEQLPAGFTLIYASSDAGGTEFIANMAIARCDTLASQLLREIEGGARKDGYETDPSLPFARFRRWHFEPA